MSEDQKPEGQVDENRVSPGDWNNDHFPTSAKRVYIGWAIMLSGIALLCFAVYATSEHPSDGEVAAKKPSLAKELDVSSDE